MQNQGKRDLIKQYRELMKRIKGESDEAKRNELKKQASEVYDLMLKNEFEDENIERFTK